MPAERLSMRKIREILRLKWEQGLSHRKIAESCVVSRSSVSDYLRRAEAAGLSWPLPPECEEEQLEAMLFSFSDGQQQGNAPEPVWSAIPSEYKKKGVTLALLWQEYKTENPPGWQYSFFCEQYRRWLQTVDPVLRHQHKAGEKMLWIIADKPCLSLSGRQVNYGKCKSLPLCWVLPTIHTRKRPGPNHCRIGWVRMSGRFHFSAELWMKLFRTI